MPLLTTLFYNLVTGLHRTLDIVHNDFESLTLAFDPSKSAHYKLVCVKAADPSVEDFSPFCNQINVFDSESSSWSVVVTNFTVPLDMPLSDGVYWNNAVHWNILLGALVYFDIDKGIIGEASEIHEMYQRRFSYFTHLLVESGGHLHYIISDKSRASVFKMERDYSNWSFQYDVEFGGLSYAFMNNISLRGIVRARNEEKSFLLIYVSGKLMAYNGIDGSFWELTGLGMEEFNRENPLHIRHDDVHQFVESLAPV